jgi:hypothetical protein
MPTRGANVGPLQPGITAAFQPLLLPVTPLPSCFRWNVNEQLRRYVALEAPDPGVKLQTLSDIAQEHQASGLGGGRHGRRRSPRALARRALETAR